MSIDTPIPTDGRDAADRRMILQFRVSGPPREIVFSEKETSRSLSYDGVPIDYYDRQGRLVGIFIDDRHYRRGLDNRLLEKFRRPGERVRVRRDVDEPRKRRLIDDAYSRARSVAEEIRRGSLADLRAHGLDPSADARTLLLDKLGPILSYDYARLEEERREFDRVYAPVSILPPDQYMSLVIQITIGCSWSRCTFCDFYRGRPFRIRTPEELRGHIRGALGFLGESATLRRSVFLADGNALVIPQGKLLDRLAVVHEFFAFTPPEIEGRAARAAWRRAHPGSFEGLYSFLDAFSTLKKSVADFEALRARHLRRVYVGLESGNDELLRFLRKPGDAAGMIEATRIIKSAGLAVGIVIMVGVGGEGFAQQHARDTVAVVNEMGLGEGDFVYLSDFVNHPGLPYERMAREAGIGDLPHAAVIAQRERLRAGFRWRDPAHPPQVALYDIREFVY